MRASIAFVFVLFALTAAAQDQKVVSVWEGYEYRTSDWAHCRRLLEDYLAAVDFRSPLCEYQHIGDLLRDGWIVNHSIPIETEIVHGRTRIEGCWLFELKCVGRSYFMTRDEDYVPPPPRFPN